MIILMFHFKISHLNQQSVQNACRQQRTGLCDVGHFEKRPPGTEDQLKN